MELVRQLGQSLQKPIPLSILFAHQWCWRGVRIIFHPNRGAKCFAIDRKYYLIGARGHGSTGCKATRWGAAPLTTTWPSTRAGLTGPRGSLGWDNCRIGPRGSWRWSHSWISGRIGYRIGYRGACPLRSRPCPGPCSRPCPRPCPGPCPGHRGDACNPFSSARPTGCSLGVLHHIPRNHMKPGFGGCPDGTNGVAFNIEHF